MTHQDAVEQMAVERYLLGELTGASRDHFEEHLFDCGECAADLKQGVVFLEAARTEWKTQAKPVVERPQLERQRITRTEAKLSPSRFAWLWQPWVLAPALAACLAVIVYQSAIVMPGMKAELAQLQEPAVREPLVLANAGARGGDVPSIVAPRHGSYLLSVDIPTSAAASYRCSLYSHSGKLLWQLDISPRQVHDAVTIQVPVMTAQEGMNELHVQSISSSAEVPPVDVATYRYNLKLAR